MTNLQKYNNIFKEVFNVETSDLNDKFTFQDISQWDSVVHLMLISSLEEAFDIMFEANDILNYISYKNGIEILKKYGIEFEQ